MFIQHRLLWDWKLCSFKTVHKTDGMLQKVGEAKQEFWKGIRQIGQICSWKKKIFSVFTTEPFLTYKMKTKGCGCTLCLLRAANMRLYSCLSRWQFPFSKSPENTPKHKKKNYCRVSSKTTQKRRCAAIALSEVLSNSYIKIVVWNLPADTTQQDV